MISIIGETTKTLRTLRSSKKFNLFAAGRETLRKQDIISSALQGGGGLIRFGWASDTKMNCPDLMVGDLEI